MPPSPSGASRRDAGAGVRARCAQLCLMDRRDRDSLNQRDAARSQCTNVRTSEKAIPPDLVIDPTRHAVPGVRLRRASRLGVDSRHQLALVSSSDTMTRHTAPDLLPARSTSSSSGPFRPSRSTAGRFRSASSRSPRTSCRSIRARSTRPSIASSTGAGSRPSGPSRSWVGGPSTTGSRQPDAGSWRSKPASGNACPRPSAG